MTLFSSSSSSPSSSAPLLAAVEHRRTVYALNKDLPKSLTDDKIREIVNHLVKHTPSSFNAQSARLVVLLGPAHDKFWGFVGAGLQEKIGEERYKAGTAAKIAGFSGAYGTILFYEDPAPVKALADKFPSYAANFPIWSEHTSAMHQILAWTALEAEGAGANLQHYSPVPDAATAAEWNIPTDWKLTAQLVFGGRQSAENLPKEFKPLEGERVFYHTS